MIRIPKNHITVSEPYKIDILLSFLECPGGWRWMRVNDTCIWESRERKSFDDAVKRCQVLYPGGARLYEPPNKSHNDLTSSILSIETDHWIGIHERLSEDSWLYLSSNERVHNINWDRESGQPNDHNEVDQDCVTILSNNGYRWNDDSCDTERHFICEKKLLV